ncbi:DUF2955 domain-containing protein [Tropicimonas sp. TH_r6]|uniref:DUF2955 domain-containing protein n=1 Tax=Tropicimonas sp. TH_r6 TaxID=3082085 RepID=UPI0029541BD1|nr:DUF2955 domain-containing protein [Tropicimonas sp. TH_r6]MDV7145381.1 DUF2955 domain-containing protein [Tropicimonas sp. TH_r6]
MPTGRDRDRDRDEEALRAALLSEPELDTRKGVRLALGVGFCFLLGMALQWPFAFLAAIFAGLFLQGDQAPRLKASVTLIAMGLVSLMAGLLLFSALEPYPAVFLVAQLVLLVWAFSLSVSGKPVLMVLLALMGVLLMPYLVGLSHTVALQLAVWMPLNMALAFLVCAGAFALLPTESGSVLPGAAAPAAAFDPERRLVRMTLVAAPFTLAFQLSSSGAVLTLLFVAILAQQLAASTRAGPAVARGMLLANLTGGATAVLAYELVVINTHFGFMAVVTLVICLIMAQWFVSGRPDAALAGSALTTFIILFGGSMAPFGGDVEVKMLDRLVQVAAALIWVLGAFLALDAFLPEREPVSRGPNWRSRREQGAPTT